MGGKWYVARNGVTSAPRTWEQVVAAAQVGEIAADDLLWSEGDSTSRAAGDVPGLVTDIVARSGAWLMSGRGDPQQPARRVLNRRGRLVLLADRLRFVAGGNRILLDLPLAELHSVAPAEAGEALEVWHGPTRHRFLIPGSAEMIVPGLIPSGPISTALFASNAAALGRVVRLNRMIVQQWVALLTPMVAVAPPPGVRVRPPRRGLTYVVLMVFKGLLLLLAVATICLAPILMLAG